GSVLDPSTASAVVSLFQSPDPASAGTGNPLVASFVAGLVIADQSAPPTTGDQVQERIDDGHRDLLAELGVSDVSKIDTTTAGVCLSLVDSDEDPALFTYCYRQLTYQLTEMGAPSDRRALVACAAKVPDLVAVRASADQWDRNESYIVLAACV